MTVRERERFRGKREGGRVRAKKTDGLLDRTGGRRGIIEKAREREILRKYSTEMDAERKSKIERNRSKKGGE